jgi:diaminopimelate epimerase
MTKRNQRAGVSDRWYNRDGTPSSRHGQGLRWMFSWVDDVGREHSQSFRTKTEANRRRDELAHSQLEGTYVDPKSGKVTLRSFYADWSRRQVWVWGTRDGMDRAIGQTSFLDV